MKISHKRINKENLNESKKSKSLNGKNNNNKKIKILHICSSLNLGGVETVVYNFYNYIDKTKFEFYFVTFDTKVGCIEKKIGYNIFHITPFKKSKVAYIKELNSIIQNYDFDIVHSHIGIYSFIVLFIAWKNKVKIRICHSHNCIKNMSIVFKIKKYIYQKLNNLFSTHFMSCGIEAGIWQFGYLKYHQNKVFLLNNPINISKFQFSSIKREEYRTQYNLNHKNVIGHIGRFSFEKNHEFILKIALLLKEKKKNFCIILIGDGIEFEKIKEKIRINKLSEYFLLLGFRNDISEIINAFDIFILPSLFEAFPVTLIEAQANGLHCIVSNNVPKEIKFDNKVEFLSIKDDDVKLWYDALLKRTHYNILNRNYNDKIKKYDIESIVLELSKYYLNAMEVKK